MTRLLAFLAVLSLIASCSSGPSRTERAAEERMVAGDDHFQRGDYIAAIPIYRDALGRHPDYPRALLQLGISWERLGMVKRALELYQRLRASAPESEAASAAGRRVRELEKLKKWNPNKGPKAKEILD